MSAVPVEQRMREQENLIRQDFSASKPLKKLLTDISQIPCQDGKLYISPILDCYNRKILSLIMRDNMKKELLWRISIYRMKRDTVKTLIFRYAFTYYNRMRINTFNPGGYPPVVYRTLQEELLSA